ncbi:MAG: hypothetical protein ACRC9Q_04230 [Bacteroidales bacterium]
MISSLSQSALLAQNEGPSPSDRERFKAEKMAFIVKEVGLTPEEAGKLFPIYEQMQEKMFMLHRDLRIKSRQLREKPKVSDKEYSEMTYQMIHMDGKKATIEEAYYKEFEKILSPEKLYKLKNAENKFAVHLFHGRGKARNANAPKTNTK